MANEQKKTAAELKAEYDRLAKATTEAYKGIPDALRAIDRRALDEKKKVSVLADELKAKKGAAFTAWKAQEAAEAESKQAAKAVTKGR